MANSVSDNDGGLATIREFDMKAAISSQPLRNSVGEDITRGGVIAAERKYREDVVFELRLKSVARDTSGNLRKVFAVGYRQKLASKDMVAGG